MKKVLFVYGCYDDEGWLGFVDAENDENALEIAKALFDTAVGDVTIHYREDMGTQEINA